MSEQTGSDPKRRRIEKDGSSSSTPAVASTSSSGASTPSTSAVTGTIRKLKNEAVVLPAALNVYLNLEVDHGREAPKFLIVDCRDSDRFQKKKIKSAACVNAPIRILKLEASSDVITFGSKMAVIENLVEYCPELLVHLRPPGHYFQIVILDDNSTAAQCSKTVHLILDAVIKWNEKTRTTIRVLDGGLDRFAKEFPNLVVTSNETDSADLHLDRTPSIADILLDYEDSPNLEMETAEQFFCYLKDLDEMISILRKLITLKAKLVALESLRLVLLGELTDEEDKLTANLDTSVPDVGKCPVCFEVFRGEILQCKNGHSICSRCCDTLANCPECRVPYLEKVRNRALEHLLENSWKVECVCGVKLELKEVEDHVQVCAKKSADNEVDKVENDVGVTKGDIDEMTENLGKISKVILDTEKLWYSRLNNDQEVTPRLWKNLCGYRSVKKSIISSLEKTLFLMISSDL